MRAASIHRLDRTIVLIAEKGEKLRKGRHSRILAASRTCFVQFGFHGTSMAKIAKMAGISVGLIYRYFDCKQSLIVAVAKEQLDCALENIRGASSIDELLANSVTSPAGSVAELFTAITVEALRNPEVARIVGDYDKAVRNEIVNCFLRSMTQSSRFLDTERIEQRALLLTLAIDGLSLPITRDPACWQLLRPVIEGMIVLDGGSQNLRSVLTDNCQYRR